MCLKQGFRSGSALFCGGGWGSGYGSPSKWKIGSGFRSTEDWQKFEGRTQSGHIHSDGLFLYQKLTSYLLEICRGAQEKGTNVQGWNANITEDLVRLGCNFRRAQKKGTNGKGQNAFLPEDVVWLGWGLSLGAGKGNKRTGTKCLFTRRCSLAWQRRVEGRRKGNKRTGTNCLLTRRCSLAWLRLVKRHRKREQTYRDGLFIYQKM